MWPRDWISGTADVSLKLREWNGCIAQGWAYSISHSQLLIRLYREADNQPSKSSLYLYLKDCQKISFSDRWNDASILIEERTGQFGREYILSDGDRFYVLCGVAPLVAESEEFVSFERPALGH